MASHLGGRDGVGTGAWPLENNLKSVSVLIHIKANKTKDHHCRVYNKLISKNLPGTNNPVLFTLFE